MKKKYNIAMVSRGKLVGAWMVHVFTASGAFFGLLAMLAIHAEKFIQAIWWMGATIFIDSVDGYFARKFSVATIVSKIDGSLLDNIVDFFNYTLVPCFMLLVSQLLPHYIRLPAVLFITLSSAYQFTHIEAKTQDHFFRGFPSYWNIAVFYLFFWQMPAWINAIVVFLLAGLSFIPIKYVYPSRLDYLARSRLLRLAVLLATIVWGIGNAWLLWLYPDSSKFLVMLSLGYPVLYVVISLYRTFVPLLLESPH